MLNDMHTLEYMPMEVATTDVCVVPEIVLNLALMGQLVVDQLIVRTTGWTALSVSLVKPEPHNGSVVFFTCRELYHDSLGL